MRNLRHMVLLNQTWKSEIAFQIFSVRSLHSVLTYSRITPTKSSSFYMTPSAHVSQTLGSSYISHVTAASTTQTINDNPTAMSSAAHRSTSMRRRPLCRLVTSEAFKHRLRLKLKILWNLYYYIKDDNHHLIWVWTCHLLCMRNFSLTQLRCWGFGTSGLLHWLHSTLTYPDLSKERVTLCSR
jgi:hypothetical protein